MLTKSVLAICITSTNTLSTLLSMEGTSIPAFQTLFNYILLNLIYTSYTLYKYGFKKWLRLVWRDGWRFFILAFMDVEGNYFTVLAYRYTTILSAQLINFWAIVVVVIISFLVLKVRYHWTQYSGILLCIGGMGVLFGSDHLTGNNAFPAADQVKGDLFALLGATFYGLSNVLEEFLVSKRPMYEVIGQLAFWAMIINGVQAGIFDRGSFATAVWNSRVGGYLTGYTLILSLFYSLAPLMFRLSSAAFFNISLLTGNFWGVAIGVKVFHYSIHWMYPIAFVLIILGLVVYFCRQSMLAEANKPWLGENQEGGVAGIGTARRRVERPSAIV
jgi:solute carrier family 35 protein F1/2